jgi:hypothetical protein
MPDGFGNRALHRGVGTLRDVLQGVLPRLAIVSCPIGRA